MKASTHDHGASGGIFLVDGNLSGGGDGVASKCSHARCVVISLAVDKVATDHVRVPNGFHLQVRRQMLLAWLSAEAAASCAHLEEVVLRGQRVEARVQALEHAHHLDGRQPLRDASEADDV